MESISPDERHWRHAPRWEALLAIVVIGGGYALLPEGLSIGPRWLLGVLTVALLVPLNAARFIGNYRLVRTLSVASSLLITAAIIGSTVLLVIQLPNGKASATSLLRDGGLIWGINVLVFAIWYWEIDGGGPHTRHRTRYTSTDFLFPQMTMNGADTTHWSPNFVDYLFLSFNTSSAFSPTDTLILSRPPKVLMMVQSLISIVVVAVLISRAINTLGA